MRKLFFLFLFISTISNSQTQIGTSFKTGFDRVGLYFDQTLNFDLNDNQFDFGLRYYGPDFVFEKNIVGLSLGYTYNFYPKNSRFYLGPGIAGSFFHENKTSTEFYLSNFIIHNRIGYCLSPRWSVFGSTGFGMVVDKINSYITGESQTVGYFNYEITLGIKYYWKIKLYDDMRIEEI